MTVNKKNIIIFTVIMLCILSSCKNYSIDSNDMPRSYFLENATQKDKMEKMLSVTLYDNGEIKLAIPWISSFAFITPCKYSIEKNELLVRYENSDEIIAAFTIDDDGALIFKGSSLRLYADSGARYVYAPRWILMDEDKKITVYAENIPGIDVFRIIGEETDRWIVEDKNEIIEFAEWSNSLVLENVVFDSDDSPEESGDAYLFKASFGGDMFIYSKFTDDECYVHFGGEWYHVKNPSSPPF